MLNVYNEFLRNLIQLSNRFIFWLGIITVDVLISTGVAFRGYFYPALPDLTQIKLLVYFGI